MNRIFSAYLLGMGLWTSTSVMWFADFPVLGDLPWLQAGMFFSIIAWMLMCRLFVAILGLDSVPAIRAGLWAIYGLGGLLLIGALGGQLVHVIRIERGYFDVQFAGLIYLFFALAGLSGVAFALLFARAIPKTDDHNQRNRLFYVAIGNILIVIGGLANLSPQLRPIPFDVLYSVIAALLMAYAIYRYQLLDVTFVVRKGLLYFIPTAIIGGLYFVIIFFAVQVLQAFLGYHILLLSLLIAVVTVMVVQPLRERVQAWVDRLFFREKYDAYLMLQKLSREVASIIRLEELLDMIFEELAETMHIARMGVFLKEESAGDFLLVARRGLDEELAHLSLRKDHTIVDWLVRERGILTRHEMDVDVHFRALCDEEREELERMEVELFIPLRAKDQLVGILAVGPKLSEVTYSQDDQLTLATLADQVAIAIENARLYKEVQEELAERKRAEEEREKLQAQLTQAHKLESIGRLAGGVAHDFNNMLSVILGYTELALKQVDPAQPLFADLGEIRKAANRSASLTRQLLAFARKQTIAPRVLDLNETVEGMLKMLRRLIGEDIDLAWLPGTGALLVKMDPSQIDQILANLCVNARDAIEGVGKVAIETDTVTVDEDYCADHVGFVPGEFVLLAVSDDGSGMDKETLDNIFEPFFTTKGVDEGIGLGLATIYGSVRQNNGFINVYSEPGKGTTFKIYLPRYVGQIVEDQMASATPIPKGRGETVLVVEDEVSILKLAEKILDALGYRVLTAETSAEALDLAGKHTGEISLLITDVVMPEMNGRDLAERLLSIDPNLKCLYMSGYTTNVIANRGVLDEGVNFIQKPFSTSDLADKVREALDTK